MQLSALAQRLVHYFSAVDSCAVAYSGGVDSAVVAKAAYLALADKAVAVTAVSESLGSGEVDIAQRVAESIGIKHEQVFTDELSDSGYVANDGNRCWHCKSILYDRIRVFCDAHGFETIANGTILDDLDDYRPGLLAAKEAQVLSPLAELEIGKVQVRELAEYWKLEVWNKPASPCLSSRVVYGLSITPEILNRIDAAEAYLKALGFPEVRVRYHQNELARIEVPGDQLPALLAPQLRHDLASKFKEFGFRFVTIDLEGFRSGNLNELVQLRV